MSRFDTLRARSTWRDILEGQPQHVGLTVFLLCGAAWLLEGSEPHGRFLGLDSLGWAWASIWLAVAHQVIVAIVFRLQLHRALLTRCFGDRDLKIWTAIFIPLLLARPLTLAITAILDRGSLGDGRVWQVLLGAALLAVSIYTLRSVLKYFTIRRAVGGDHFRTEYHDMPFVREGAFRYTDNAMYGIAFLGLWGIALLFGSWQALVVAAFQHAYIWVHMYTVEDPDIRQLYGSHD